MSGRSVALTGPDPLRARNPRELIFAYDDNHATASLTFPSLTYESIVRFELPPGKHRPLRLRLLAQSSGTVAITIYDNSVFECPGEPIHVITRELLSDDLSNGKDSRWIVEDLQDLPPLKGTLWMGVRKIGGEPSLWTSAVVSGQSYLRDRDPARALGPVAGQTHPDDSVGGSSLASADARRTLQPCSR